MVIRRVGVGEQPGAVVYLKCGIPGSLAVGKFNEDIEYRAIQ
jgi:hypothetical protein